MVDLYQSRSADAGRRRQARGIGEILEAATTIAVVGTSRDPDKSAGAIPLALQRRGFRIIPINPHADMLFGEPVYRSLAEVDRGVDIVVVFRPSQEAPRIAREAAGIGAGTLWLQDGLKSREARQIARSAAMEYVEDRCIAVAAALHRVWKRAA